MKVIEGIKSKCCDSDVYKIYNERCPGQEEEFICVKCDKECDFYEPITNMNNKQEELEKLKPNIKDLTGNFEQAKDIIQMFFDEYWLKQKPAIRKFILQREAEIRKEEYDRCIGILDKSHKTCPIPESCIGYQNALSDLMNNPPQ